MIKVIRWMLGLILALFCISALVGILIVSNIPNKIRYGTTKQKQLECNSQENRTNYTNGLTIKIYCNI